jgi:hypothetical protein
MLLLAFLTLITVEGRVLDAVTQQPIAEARVVLLREVGTYSYSSATWTTPVTETYAPDARVISLRTNELGVFRFEIAPPAKFRLFVSKDGYVRDGESRLDLSEDRKDILIRLTPEGAITGQVADADTREPVRGLRVVPWGNRDFGHGRTLWPAGEEGKTNAEGRYSLTGLPPGEYLLELTPPLGRSFAKPRPVEDFAADVRLGYGPVWYPGVPTSAEAARVYLFEGNAATGTDFKVAKRPMAVLRGVVSAPPDLGEIRLMLTMIKRSVLGAGFGVVANGSVKPGEAFEVDNLPPGDYFLSAAGPGDAEERLAYSQNIQLDDRNVDLGEIVLRRGLDYTGRVTVEGADPPPSLEGFRVLLHSPLRLGFGGGDSSPEIDPAAGTFVIRNSQPERVMVRTQSLPKGFLVREVRYNGVLAAHGLFEPDPGSVRQELEVVLAPASSALQVTVTDGTRPLKKARVLLVQEPLIRELPDRFRPYTTDDEGRVTIQQLLPGKYRLAAYSAGVDWMGDPLLDQRFASAQEVNVAPGATAAIQIRAVMQ